MEDTGKKGKPFTREDIELFQLRRNIVNLYKAFLIMLEDLEQEHIMHFSKLYETFKDDLAIIKQADYLTQEKISYLRKKVLDAGNDCIRNVTGEKDEQS